jgi:hypothetical protein
MENLLENYIPKISSNDKAIIHLLQINDDSTSELQWVLNRLFDHYKKSSEYSEIHPVNRYFLVDQKIENIQTLLQKIQLPAVCK